jgi:hypothetical protein
LASRARAKRQQQDDDAAKHPLKWYVQIKQPGKLVGYVPTYRWSPAYIRREPFLIEIKEPSDVPIRVTISGR